MNKFYCGVTLIFSFGLVACSSTQHFSPIVDRTHKNVAATADVAKVAPVAGPGFYVVKKGDTLYRIALDHGQSYSDIVSWNGLSNPNDIKVDQMLRVASAEPNSVGVKEKKLAAPVRVKSKAEPVRTVAPEDNSLKKTEGKSSVQSASVTASASASATNGGKINVAEPSIVSADTISWRWPTEGKIIASFEEGKNKGIDIAGKSGQAISAASAGKVMYSGNGIPGYGNLVIVKHSANFLSVYAHAKTILVKEGDSVMQGQKIAEMGATGSDGVLLHFEIRQQGKPIDPLQFLSKK